MESAFKGIIPPKEYFHDPELKDKFGNTVALTLIKRGIIPPSEWLYPNEKLLEYIKANYK